MTIQIGICDDEDYFIDQLRKCVEQYANESSMTEEISIFHSGREILDDREKRDKLDIVFLDVDMPDINGIETAKRLRDKNDHLAICFVTSYENYSFSAFQVDALGYTLKPAQYQDVAHFMEKALLFLRGKKEQKENESSRYIQVNIKKEMTLIEINQILYVEKQRNQCILYCDNMQIACYETLEHLYQQLDSNQFIYTNQGYVVNLSKVKEVTKTMVLFSDGIKVPISRNKYKDVHDKYVNRLLRVHQMKSIGLSLT